MVISENKFSDSENDKHFLISEDKWFYFKHGRRTSSIEELKEALDNIHEDEFRHHVTADKNDFANWVEHVFGETKLAKDMREVSEKDGLLILLDDFLDEKHRKKQAEEIAADAHDEPKFQEEETKPEIQSEPMAEHTTEHKAVHRTEHRRESKRVIIPEDRHLDMESEETQTPTQFYVPSAPPRDKVPTPEKALSEQDIQALVEEAKEVFEREREHESRPRSEHPHHAERFERFEMDEREPERAPEHMHYRFVVKEFIYGFLIGLIFGLIMLGVILNLN